jgi:hypothetical protein
VLLERLEHRLDRLVEAVAEPGEVGGAADDDALVVALVGHRLDQGGRDHGSLGPVLRRDLVSQRCESSGREGDRLTHRAAVDARAQVGQRVLAELQRQLDDPLLDATRGEDQHDQQAGGGELDQLDVPHARARKGGVLDDRDLLGELREQPHRSLHHVVEVVGTFEERGDRPALGGTHRLDLGQPVHEEPVALVGRDPARAGVRLGDQPLLLQRGHVVADRRG